MHAYVQGDDWDYATLEWMDAGCVQIARGSCVHVRNNITGIEKNEKQKNFEEKYTEQMVEVILATSCYGKNDRWMITYDEKRECTMGALVVF